jgi:hypothetical protein
VTDVDELHEVLGFRLADPEKELKSLDDERARTSPTNILALGLLKKKAHLLFLASFCITKFETLRPKVIARLRSLEITLSCKEDAEKLTILDMPTGWELPSSGDGSRTCYLRDIDYGTMKPLESSSKVFRCRGCQSYWERTLRSRFLGATCPPCEAFEVTIGTRIADLSAEAPEPLLQTVPLSGQAIPGASSYSAFYLLILGMELRINK